MVYKPTYNWGAPSCRCCGFFVLFSLGHGSALRKEIVITSGYNMDWFSWENLTGTSHIFHGKNPWVSGEDFPEQTNPMMVTTNKIY